MNFKPNSDLSTGISEENIEVWLNIFSLNSVALYTDWFQRSVLRYAERRSLWLHPLGHITPELNYNSELIQVKQNTSLLSTEKNNIYPRCGKRCQQHPLLTNTSTSVCRITSWVSSLVFKILLKWTLNAVLVQCISAHIALQNVEHVMYT